MATERWIFPRPGSPNTIAPRRLEKRLELARDAVGRHELLPEQRIEAIVDRAIALGASAQPAIAKKGFRMVVEVHVLYEVTGVPSAIQRRFSRESPSRRGLELMTRTLFALLEGSPAAPTPAGPPE